MRRWSTAWRSLTFLGWTLLGGGAWQTALLNADRRADHHLPLRAGPRRAGGPGDRERPADAPGHPAQVGDRAGTARPGRHGRVRQDRHADRGPARAAAAAPCEAGHHWRRGMARRRLAPSAGPGAGRGGAGGRRRPPASRRCRAAACAGYAREANGAWAAATGLRASPEDDAAGAELWLARPGAAPVRFAFADALRPDAAVVVGELQRRGYAVALLSGDRAPPCGRCAGRARHRRLAGRLHAGRQGPPGSRPGPPGARGADGRRRPQRCAGARRRPCLAVAGDARSTSARPPPTRCSRAPAGAGARGDRGRAAGRAAGQAELRARRSATICSRCRSRSWAT